MTTTPQVPGALTAMAISSFNCAVRAALHRYDIGTLDFAESLDAIEVALNTVRPEPAAAPAAGEPAKQRSSIPAGWRIERLDDKPFKGIGIATPDGKSCIVWSHNRNPESVLYALAEALIGRNTDE